MARALFILPETLKKNSIVNGSTDPDLFVNYMYLAQDIHLHDFLGTDLYRRLQAGMLADDLTANEIILLDDYIQDTLIHFAMYIYLPFSPYNIANGGAIRLSPENTETISPSEMEKLALKHKGFAEYYAQRLVSYLCDNKDLYPEYSTNTGADIKPSKSVHNAGGFFIPGDKPTNEFWKIDE